MYLQFENAVGETEEIEVDALAPYGHRTVEPIGFATKFAWTHLKALGCVYL